MPDIVSIVEGNLGALGSVSGTDRAAIGLHPDYNRAQRVYIENPLALITTATGVASFVGAGEVTVNQEGTVITISGTPHEAVAGVSSINALEGVVLITGTQNVSTQTTGQTVTIIGPDLSSYASTASLVTVSGHLQDQIDGISDALDPAIIGSDGITVVSGSNNIEIQGFYTEFTNASGALSSEIDTDIATHVAISDAHHSRYTDAEAVTATESARYTMSGTLSAEIDADITTHASDASAHHTRYSKSENDAITGSDGITISSGTNTIEVQGFRDEFVSASGSLQNQIIVPSGAVVFGGADTLLDNNDPLFNYDKNKKALSIGNVREEFNFGGIVNPPTNVGIDVSGGAYATGLVVQYFGANFLSPPTVAFRRGRGTVDSPNIVQQDDIIGTFAWGAWAGTTQYGDNTLVGPGTMTMFADDLSLMASGLVQGRLVYSFPRLRENGQVGNDERVIMKHSGLTVSGTVDTVSGTVSESLTVSGVPVNLVAPDVTLGEVVTISGHLQNEIDNHLYAWYQNGFVNRDDSSISFDDGTRTFEITPTGASFSYTVSGTEYIVNSTDSVVIDDTEGLWAIYYDGGTLSALTPVTHSGTADLILNKALVSYVYWDADNNLAQVFDERHGLKMAPPTHLWIHETVGTEYQQGLGLNNLSIDQSGADDADAQFGVDWGEIFDEDLEHEISAVSSTAGLTVFYQENSNWRWDTLAGFSLLISGAGGYPYVNSGTGLDELTANQYMLTHVFASNSITTEPIAIMGRNTYTTARDASHGAIEEMDYLVASGLGNLSPELKAIASVIVQASGTNSVKAKIVSTDTGDSYVDWRESPVTTAVGPEDHSTLYNLDVDSHTQYVLVDGSRGFTGTVDGIYPTELQHLATAQFVYATTLTLQSYVDANYVSLDGDTMTGALGIYADPVEALHVVGSGYITDELIVGSGTGDSDSVINWKSGGILMYTMGVDIDDGDNFKVSSSAGLGVEDFVVVDLVGNITTPAGGFYPSGGFHPRRISQTSPPVSGTDSDEIGPSEFLMWHSPNDSKVLLVYNDPIMGVVSGTLS